MDPTQQKDPKGQHRAAPSVGCTAQTCAGSHTHGGTSSGQRNSCGAPPSFQHCSACTWLTFSALPWQGPSADCQWAGNGVQTSARRASEQRAASAALPLAALPNLPKLMLKGSFSLLASQEDIACVSSPTTCWQILVLQEEFSLLECLPASHSPSAGRSVQPLLPQCCSLRPCSRWRGAPCTCSGKRRSSKARAAGALGSPQETPGWLGMLVS